MKNLDYELLKKEIIDSLEKSKSIVLATSRVTESQLEKYILLQMISRYTLLHQRHMTNASK